MRPILPADVSIRPHLTILGWQPAKHAQSCVMLCSLPLIRVRARDGVYEQREFIHI